MKRGTGERGPQISADDLARAWAVYQEKGTYQAAADAIGRSESPVRRALLRRYTGERSAKVDPYARALDEVAGDLAETHRLTARRLRQALRAADDTTLPDIVAQINDTVRALTSTRVAHAKLTGDHAPDKHAVTVDAVDEISRRITRLAESDEKG